MPFGGETTRYYYDGLNEVAEFNDSDYRVRYYVHGVSYLDERLMMYSEEHQAEYYYTLDGHYNVRGLVDHAGSLVERHAYDPYGWPHIRESAGRGDMDNDTDLDSTDSNRLGLVAKGTIWDPRGDLDDDGDVDTNDAGLLSDKKEDWPPASSSTVVDQAFSDVGNPYMFQGVPGFALDTASTAGDPNLPLNHHRARFNDPGVGRWLTRDPIGYWDSMNLYEFILSRPTRYLDPTGLVTAGVGVGGGVVLPGPGGISFGVQGDASAHLGWNSTDGITFTGIIGGGGRAGTGAYIGAGPLLTFTSAPTVDDLVGPGIEIGGDLALGKGGGSLSVIGGATNTGAPWGGVQIGVGPGFGADVGGGTTISISTKPISDWIGQLLVDIFGPDAFLDDEEATQANRRPDDGDLTDVTGHGLPADPNDPQSGTQPEPSTDAGPKPKPTTKRPCP